jgi:hypothetical protein
MRGKIPVVRGELKFIHFTCSCQKGYFGKKKPFHWGFQQAYRKHPFSLWEEANHCTDFLRWEDTEEGKRFLDFLTKNES